MIVEEVLDEFPDYKDERDELDNLVNVTQHKNYEVKCRRIDIDQTFTTEEISYDHNNEVIWIDIRRE